MQVVSDGVKTNRQLLNQLYALIDMSKITTRSKLLTIRNNNVSVNPVCIHDDTHIQCGRLQSNTPTFFGIWYELNTSTSLLMQSGIADVNNPSFYVNNPTFSVVTSGLTYRFVY